MCDAPHLFIAGIDHPLRADTRNTPTPKDPQQPTKLRTLSLLLREQTILQDFSILLCLFVGYPANDNNITNAHKVFESRGRDRRERQAIRRRGREKRKKKKRRRRRWRRRRRRRGRRKKKKTAAFSAALRYTMIVLLFFSLSLSHTDDAMSATPMYVNGQSQRSLGMHGMAETIKLFEAS